MADIGTSIRALRNQHNLKQEELASLLHVTRQTISNYETGKSEPDLDTLVRIAEIFETDVNTLLEQKRQEESIFPSPNLRQILTDILLLGIAFAIAHLLQDAAHLWGEHHYDMTFLFFVCTVIYPLCFLLLGRTIIQVLQQIFPFPNRKLWYKPLYVTVLLFTAINLLLYLPLLIWCMENLVGIISQAMISSHIPYVRPIDTKYFPDLHAWFLITHRTICGLLYTLCGATLRLTKTKKPEVT